jgi:hypothetical protein
MGDNKVSRRKKDHWFKWVYKQKLKDNGEIDKYKARSVAKDYK